MRTAFKILLALALVAGLIVPAGNVQAVTNNITVNPDSVDWAFLVETAGTNSGSFVSGPGTPPVGSGSLRFTVDSAAGLAFITQKYQSTLLADIDTFSYSTYVTTGSGATAPTFQFNYDPDLTDANIPWYGRLVYEPYMNGTVTTGTWQTWDMLAGKWWASNNANSTVDEACTQANPCTVAELLAAFPNLGIRNDNSAILFKAGSGWAGGFDGNVDNFIVEIGGDTDIYDFEPYLPVHNITQNIKYTTIQAGINGANPGDVLEIDPGTYVENVVVNKSITLRGSGDGANPAVDTILDGTTLTGMGIRLNNNITDVTIEGMRIINYDVTNPSAGIYGNLSNHNLTIQNVTVNGNGPGVISASGGIVLNGPINNVLIDNVTAHNNWGRGIVIWNGSKTNITITNNDVRNNNCCGIELQDGTASGVTMTGNTVIGNADSGMSATGLTSGAGPNLIANNTVTNNGRFGIEIKFPNGTGATSGDGSIVIENNNVSLPNPSSDLRDFAGISVYRRGYLVGAGYANIPTGVVVRNNTVSDYRQTNGGSFSTGFGIVVEGTKMRVEGNTLINNDVGIQVQAGHLPYTPNTAVDGNQANLDDDYFGRGNSPIACASVGINTLSSNDVDYRTVGAGANGGAAIHNETSGAYFCTIQQAIDAANSGDTIRVPAGTYVEELVINKPLSLLGPNDAINPNTGSRVAEAIIQPVNIGTYPIGLECTILAYLDDSDITVKGFTFDGDNPTLNSGVTIGTADVDTCELVAGYGDGGGIVIENNILQNSVYSGVDLANYLNPPTSGNYVRYNLIRNIGEANTSFGTGVITHFNFYADVSHNVFEDVRIGVQTGNYTQPNPGFTGGINNNTINAWRLGIFHNAWYSNPSAISVSNNTINAVDSATAPSWTGILISSFQNAADTEINNNTVSGLTTSKVMTATPVTHPSNWMGSKSAAPPRLAFMY